MKLFSYKLPRRAHRTLKVLADRHPNTSFDLVMRSDWRWYIQATTPAGRQAFVQAQPLAAIANSL